MAPARDRRSFVGVTRDPITNGRPEMTDRPLTIRMATPEDDGALVRLAALDSAHPLDGPVLLAESAGVPVAAVSLGAGAVTADPFRRSAEAVRLLMLRRYQLMRQGADVGRARLLLRRLVPNPAR
jgi:hypothetical protein